MSLTEQIKTRMIAAMKAKNTLERDVMKVALGDLQMDATRKGEPLTEAEELKVLKSMVKGMNETIEAAPDSDNAQKVVQEKAILEALLPQTLSAEQIAEALAPVADAIAGAPNDGAATGVAMKHLKASGAAVDGKDVAQAVRAMRA